MGAAAGHAGSSCPGGARPSLLPPLPPGHQKGKAPKEESEEEEEEEERLPLLPLPSPCWR